MAQPGEIHITEPVSSVDINQKPHSNYIDQSGDTVEDLSQDDFLDEYSI
jgi:hypothetical protein